ncbi:MAG TPA: DUF4386 domain-containing protein [Rhizomicrobium sp.]|jgi:hypothetical protein|nr:DUF4386 domain-containing protein [Rhizomicrobium sp.]
MEIGSEPQQKAARLAGFLYLFTNLVAIFAFVVRGRVIVKGDAAQTANNILSAGPLFRAAIAAELVCVAGTIALVVALYVVLRPINRNLALLAVCWRIVENATLAVVTIAEFAMLTLLGHDAYLHTVGAPQLQSLAYASLHIYGAGFNVGFVFLGLGSALFSYLWLKSRYIPRLIAGWGIFASSMMAASMLVIIIFPNLAEPLSVFYLAPMGIYEIGLGLWLLIKGIRLPQTTTAA